MTRVFFSGPAMTRMMPSSSSTWVISRLPWRAESRAASLTRFERSAPVKPVVWPASASMLISLASGLPRVWTSRIFERPLRSGRSTTIWRSKRPGRSSAGSRMSGRFVAAMRMMLSFISKPSISTSSWFSVCSRSSCPPPRPAPRCRPTASISSMKMMQGEFCLACSKRSRTREAPTPTNISTKSEPEIEKNGTPARRAVEQDALGNPGAQGLELLRVLEELLDLVQLLDRLVDARHVAEGDLGRVDAQPLGARLAEGHHLRAAALDLVHEEDPEPDEDQERQHVGQQAQPRVGLRALDVEVDVVGVEPVDELVAVVLGIADLVLAAVLEGDLDLVVLGLDVGRLDRAVVDLLEELREVRLLGLRTGRDELLREEREHHHDEDREGCALEEPTHGKPRKTWEVSSGPLPVWAGSCRVPTCVQRGHIGEVAVPLVVVQAVADGEAVGDLEADVAGGKVDLPALGLGQQGAHLQRRRIARAEVAQQVLQGQAGVDDVLDDEHVAPLDRRVEVLEDADDARGLGGRAIGGHGHEVDLARTVDVAHEVGKEEDRPLEHADQQQIALLVVARDLGAQLADPVLELVALDEDLADGGVAHGRQSRWLGGLESEPAVQHQ